MAIRTDYHNNKHHLRHHVIPESNEGLDIGLDGQRFDTGRFRRLIADAIEAVTLTVTTIVSVTITTLSAGAATITTSLRLSFLTGPGYLKIDSSEDVAVQAVPIPIADGGTGGTTAALARTALGSTTVGDAVFIAASAAAARTAIDSPSNAEAILDTLIDAKGDLLVGTAADTVARLAVGATDGHVLTVSAAASSGMAWAAAAGGSGFNPIANQVFGG